MNTKVRLQFLKWRTYPSEDEENVVSGLYSVLFITHRVELELVLVKANSKTK